MHTGMKRLLLLGLFSATAARADQCVDCHQQVTPGIVTDWGLSNHAKEGVDCSACHGDQHRSAADVQQARIPTPETCATCHPDQVKQFMAGKHKLGGPR